MTTAMIKETSVWELFIDTRNKGLSSVVIKLTGNTFNEKESNSLVLLTNKTTRLFRRNSVLAAI